MLDAPDPRTAAADLRRAFDPTEFRSFGHRLVDVLADHLQRSLDGTSSPVLRPVAPDVMLGEIAADIPRDAAEASDDTVAELSAMIERSNHLHHPGYVGHQVATVLPITALFEAVHALLNNGMAVYEMGQAQTIMERHVMTFLARSLGFDATADGVLTHGGSLGNLTALLAARQAQAGHDVWGEGDAGARFAVLVSEQAHYCIARAVQVMGWGRGGAVAVPVDASFRMQPTALGEALARARADGRKVIAVVASCCSTATGSFDPLLPIADFCAAEGLWLHVDGAHGASFVLSERHRARLAGIERADSVVWDLHKMMMLPALATAVVFRDGRRSYEAFAQQASYLFGDADPREDWFDVGRRTLECTKRALGATAYLALRRYGTRVFAAHIDEVVATARAFADAVAASADFELAVSPEANIVCFRFLGRSASNALQPRLRRAVLARGAFYLVQTRLGDATWLRVTFMHPLTGRERALSLLDEIRAVARELGEVDEWTP